MSGLKKINYLEGLRGIACFIVVLSHFAAAFFPAMHFGTANTAHYPGVELAIANSPLNIFYSGNIAVCIFFILSGYVLSYKFFIYGDKKIVLGGMVKRYIRLAIPVFCAMMIFYFFKTSKMFFNESISAYTKSEWLQVVFINGIPTFIGSIKQGFFTAFFTGGTVYDHVLWTMNYEFYGSFIVFFFLLFAGASKYRALLYGVLTVILWNSYYVAFIIGVLLADITTKEKFKEKLRVHFSIQIILFLIAIPLGAYPRYVEKPVGIYLQMTFFSQPLSAQIYHILAATIILFFVLTNQKIQHLLETNIPNFLGKISFSLYLVHLIILFSLSSFLAPLFGKFTTIYVINILIVCFLSIPVMLGSSWLFYKYVDNKSIRLANGFAAHIVGKFSSKNKSI